MKEHRIQWNIKAAGVNCFWDKLQQQWNKTKMKSPATSNFSKQTTYIAKSF
jgi:hypothetical protein